MMFAKALLSAAVIVALATAAPAADEITSLPGWTGALPSKQYSGYISLPSGTNLHYWYVLSEKDPENAPTALWLNGGPGCSSLDGFMYEMGPFVVKKDNTLAQRPVRWNQIANVLYLESPVGVGFSYSSTNDYACSDDRSANENMQAMSKFFNELYPEYKKNPFFITGESYAGIYVPTLAEAILNGVKDGSYVGAKLSGIAVGNGCSGTEVGICGGGTQGTYSEWSYLLQTPFVSNVMKQKVNSECDWQAAANNEPDALSFKCVQLLSEASDAISNVNLYDIYGDCTSGGCVGKPAEPRGKVPMRQPLVVTDPATGQARRLQRVIPGGPDACIDSTMASSYLNQPEVMAAIHVKDPGHCWSVCGTMPAWSYNSTRTNLPRDTYPYLIANINVLIYNGDWDACVPYTDGELWTSGMNLPVKKPWHAWKVRDV